MMWKGRFKEQTDELLKKYSESVSYDWRLYKYDIQGSIAHAKGLEKAGILTTEERTKIEHGLKEIETEIDNGAFKFSPDLEDVHMNIESALTRKIGDAGAKLHTARSRNDQIALDMRLYLRHEVTEISNHLRRLQRSLVAIGARYQSTLLPGYTHLQRAQPVFFAHHMLAYVEMLQRDIDRMEDMRKRINIMPLGSGALAGSTILIDRKYVAELLGFPRVTHNSMDAVSDRDFILEYLFVLATIGMHLSRLSEDLILWSSSEFKFIVLSDRFTTGSSLMPQKKNPDVCELARGKTGRLYGNLVSVLTMMKGLPMTYNRDMQEDKERLFDSIDTVKAGLEIFAAMLLEMKVDPARINRAVNDASLLATDLADYLVLKGVPFRQAHEIIGKLVAICLEKGVAFSELPIGDFKLLSPAFDHDVFDVFDMERSMHKRAAVGAPSPQNVAAELDEWRAILGEL